MTDGSALREEASMKALWVSVIALILAGCGTMQYGSPEATAELKNAKGEVAGTASFWEDSNGVRIIVQVRGISAGKHGVHVHAVGKCDPSEFTTAGGHFNPGEKKHGLRNPAGHTPAICRTSRSQRTGRGSSNTSPNW